MATTCKLIAKTTLGSSAASVSFTSIPATYDDLLVVGSLRSDRSNVVDNVYCNFVLGSGANTSYRHLIGSGSSVTSESGNVARVAVAPGATATADTFGSFEMYIPNYAGSTAKSISSTAVQETNGATAYIQAVAALWDDSSSVTVIEFVSANADNFVAGSSAYLYGITKA